MKSAVEVRWGAVRTSTGELVFCLHAVEVNGRRKRELEDVEALTLPHFFEEEKEKRKRRKEALNSDDDDVVCILLSYSLIMMFLAHAARWLAVCLR